MDYRKLIKFGKNSYVISLPKEWLNKNNLKKGSFVYLTNRMNQLILNPESSAEGNEKKEITLNVKNDKLETIHRKIVSCYLNNYNKITILLNPQKNNKKIRDFIHSLVALEIIEQDTTKIVAKDYLNMNDISIRSLVRKLDNLIRSVIKDLDQSMKNQEYFHDAEIADEINDRDIDINKITFLVLRIIKHRLNYWVPEKNIKTQEKLITHWELAKTLESLADHIKRTTRRMIGLNLKKHGEVYELLKMIERNYLDAMKAFYMEDQAQAHEVATHKNVIMNRCADFIEEHQRELDLVKLTENIKNMITTIHNITILTYE